MARPRPKALGHGTPGDDRQAKVAEGSTVTPGMLRINAMDAKKKTDALSLRASAAKNAMR